VISGLDLQPFVAAIDAGLPMLMTAHVVYPAFDPANPATLSSVLCTELLREHLGFDRVLISDDLEMGAIANQMAPAQAVVSALRAGVDLMLICHDEAKQQAALEALIMAAQHGARDGVRLEQAASRVARLKMELPPRVSLPPERVLAVVQAEVHAALLARLAKR
jgi:beta-N-acetylhexosaminidase